MVKSSSYKKIILSGYKILLALFAIIIFINCASGSGNKKMNNNYVTLDNAIQIAVFNIEEKLGLLPKSEIDLIVPNQNKKPIIAVIDFYSPQSKSLSNYIIDKLISGLTNSKTITLVSRQHLEAIKKEMDFQRSDDYEVAEETIRAIGKKYGAQFVITGNLKEIGKLFYNFQVITLDVITGEGKAATDERINHHDDVITFLIEQDRTEAAAKVAEEKRIAAAKAAEDKAIAAAKAAEDKRIADAKAAEDKRIADAIAAENKRIADAKAAEERRIAAAKAAEELRIKKEKYKIGSRGPGGGIVFYISENIFMECVKLNDKVSGSNSKRYASSYNGGGYNNWRLPSYEELYIIYTNVKYNFPNGWYWYGSNYALNFYNGEKKDFDVLKQNVIAIRNF